MGKTVAGYFDFNQYPIIVPSDPYAQFLSCGPNLCETITASDTAKTAHDTRTCMNGRGLRKREKNAEPIDLIVLSKSSPVGSPPVCSQAMLSANFLIFSSKNLSFSARRSCAVYIVSDTNDTRVRTNRTIGKYAISYAALSAAFSSASSTATRSETPYSRSVTPAAIAGVQRSVR